MTESERQAAVAALQARRAARGMLDPLNRLSAQIGKAIANGEKPIEGKTVADKPKGKGWQLYVCTNDVSAQYLKIGEKYWLRKARNGWLEDIGCSRFAAFRFQLDSET